MRPERHAMKDSLGIEEQIEQICGIAKNCQPPLAIGVLGEWGQGKTTMMRHVMQRLESDEDCLAVWFDAWRFDASESLLLPLFATIHEHLKVIPKNQTKTELANSEKKKEEAWEHVMLGLAAAMKVEKSVQEFYNAARSIDEAKNTAKKFDQLSVQYDAIHDLKESIESYVAEALAVLRPQGTNRRLLIFVDDLDRCSPDLALTLLDQCRIHFEINNAVFIYGLNARSIDHAVAQKYGDALSGSAYLQKIVNIEFVVKNDVVPLQFLKNVYSDTFGTPDNWSQIDPFLQSVISSFVRCAKPFNPRAAKRIVQKFFLGRMGKSALAPAEWMAMLFVIAEYHPELVVYLENRKTVGSYVDAGDETQAHGKIARGQLGKSFAQIQASGLPMEVFIFLREHLPRPD